MSRKAVLIQSSILLALAIACVVTNPSEDRHLSAIVARFLAWRGEHARTCPQCKSDVMDKNQLKSMIIGGGITSGDGLRRRNYIFFSAMTKEGLADAGTIGVLGFVFGPAYRHPYPCPHEGIERIQIPKTRPLSDFRDVFIISIPANGTYIHDGEQLIIQQIQSRLDAIEDKKQTAVSIRVAGDTTSATISILTSQLKPEEFGSFSVSVLADER